MDAEQVARLRTVVFRLARHLNASATEEGLTPTQASVLGLIARRGPLGLTELTDMEGLNPTMLSRVVRKLDERGLIERLPDPSDLRAARVKITDEGRLVQERVRTVRTRAISDCLDRLPARMGADLVSALPALEALADELKPAR